MNFFKNLFSQNQDKNEPNIVDGTAKLYLQRDKSGQRIPFKIQKSTTCEEILASIKQNNPKLTFPEGSTFLIIDQLDSIEVELDPKTKPYNYLDNTTNLLCYVNKNVKTNFDNKKLKRAFDMIFKNNTIGDIVKKGKEKGQEVYITGDIYRWSRKKRQFRKKKCMLNESEFKILSSKKGFKIDIGSVVTCVGTNSGKTEINTKEPEFKGEKYLLEIPYNSQRDSLILKFKKQIEYDNWKKSFDEVITKRKEKQLDKEYNDMLDNYSCTIGINEQMIMNNCFSLKQILSMKSTRSLFYTLVNNRTYTDVFENIVEYKVFVSKGNFIEAWKKLKMLLPQLSDQNSEGVDVVKECYKDIIEDQEIDNLNHLCKVIDKIITNITINDSFEQTMRDRLSGIVKRNFFDKLHGNIIEHCFKPIFEKNFVNNDWTDPSITYKLKLLIAHYFAKSSSEKFEFNYLSSTSK